MSYDVLKKEAGGQLIDVVTVHYEGCALEFGETNSLGTCTATGEPCHQGWETCRDRENYTPVDFPVTFCTPMPNQPLDAIPLIDSVRHEPTEPKAEESLGKHGVIRIKFFDAPHDDVGIDPYVNERSYNPLKRSTFWPKLRARFPYYQGRTVEWWHGFVHEPFDLSNLRKRTFIAEDLAGFGGNRGATLKAIDVLKLADKDRAQYPRKTEAQLAEDLAEGFSGSTIDILTEKPEQFDILTFEPAGVVRIGDQCFSYSGYSAITGGVRLNGVGTVPSPYQTEDQSHSIADEVQKCIYYHQMKPVEVYRHLLETGAGIGSEFIPYADWEEENDTWHPGMRLTRIVAEPEGVADQINEIIPQAGAYGIWLDDVDMEIKYAANRPPDIGEPVADLNEHDDIMRIEPRDDVEHLVNEIIISFGQRDPTKKKDETSNYRSGILTIRPGSQSERETGRRAIKKIDARWCPSAMRGELEAISDRMLSNRSGVPVYVDFEIDRKDDSLGFADFVDLTTLAIVNRFGEETQNTTFRVIRARQDGDTMSVQARQVIFSPEFGRWAPEDIPAGLEWDDATAEQRRRYLFWADEDGLLEQDGDKVTGKGWL